MSNKELAQALVVTVKAVEVYLSSVYRKLQISYGACWLDGNPRSGWLCSWAARLVRWWKEPG
jgi:DNA-binding NarL/FixJ family response regulator